MYKHILVAVDDSKTSQRALGEAIRLARQCEAMLRIVHVVDEVSMNWNSDYGDFAEIQKRFRETGLKVLDKAGAVAREAGATFETRLLELDKLGLHVPDLIAAEANDWPADLIVIGSHGRRGVRRMLLGSVAEGVARMAPTPVLLVRGE